MGPSRSRERQAGLPKSSIRSTDVIRGADGIRSASGSEVLGPCRSRTAGRTLHPGSARGSTVNAAMRQVGRTGTTVRRARGQRPLVRGGTVVTERNGGRGVRPYQPIADAARGASDRMPTAGLEQPAEIGRESFRRPLGDGAPLSCGTGTPPLRFMRRRGATCPTGTGRTGAFWKGRVRLLTGTSIRHALPGDRSAMGSVMA